MKILSGIRKYYPAFLLLFLCQNMTIYAQDSVTFLSRVAHGKQVVIYNIAPLDEGERFLVSLKRDNAAKIKISSPMLMFFATPLQEPIYMEPGDSFVVTENKDTLRTVCLNNKTRNLELSLLHCMLQQYGDIRSTDLKTYKTDLDNKKNNTANEAQKIETLNANYENKMHFFMKHAQRMQLPDDFTHFIKSFLLFSHINKNTFGRILKTDMYSLSSFEKSILDDEKYRSVLYSTEAQYMGFLRYLCLYEARITNQDYLTTALNNFHGEVRDYILSKLIETKLQGFTWFRDLKTDIVFSISNDSLINIFFSNCRTQRYTEKVKEIVSKMKVAPNHDVFSNVEDRSFSLQEILYQGKDCLFYVDFWASWCAPCLEEMNSFEKLRKNLERNKNIQFLFISLDTDEKQWITKTKELAFLTARNSFLLAKSFNSQFAHDYKISAIPRYMLISSSGTIISADAPHPSDPKLISMINNFWLAGIK